MMKYLIIALISITFLSGCNIKSCSKKSVVGKYSVYDLFALIDTERNYLYENHYDTLFFIDSSFNRLSDYRERLITILQEEKHLIPFNKGFMIEDYFIYKKGIRKSVQMDWPYDYRSVVYMENTNEKVFLDIAISQDCRKFKVDRRRINAHRDKIIQNWLNRKTEIGRQFLGNEMVMEWEEQYDIVSKLTDDEKFCLIMVNYFWSGFYGITEKPLEEDQIKTWLSIEEIAILMYLTGNGFSF